jgi:glycyl-tRNA synthetase beta chain
VKRSDYFFELLAEEIPAWMLQGRIELLRGQLLEMIEGAFGKGHGAEVVVDATSRRIFFALSGLPPAQQDRQEVVKGPPLKTAYDAADQPTKALTGFLKKNAAAASQLRREGEYVVLQRKVEGRTAGEILTREIPGIVTGLRWPKMMRWGDSAQTYIRPVHGIISLLDGRPLPLSMFEIESGDTTEGHRILARDSVKVSGYAGYVTALRGAHVVVHSEERVESMRAQARKLASEVGGLPADDEGIWKQWRYLTESPLLVRAEFRKEFLELPEEVLITVMRVHQKQLPILVGKSLSNSFLAVADQISDAEGNAASGNSFVTNARFADARFFHQTDRKRSLESRRADLEHLQFHEKLGNYAKKSRRIEGLAAAMAREGGLDPDTAVRAARIAKCDLVTEMVKEFTDLQGRIGGIYAREEGEPEAVWQAVYDHYLPVNADDPLPRGAAGAVVSLADRIDTLAGFFLLGLKPTGSRDPFALRRTAQGLVQILLNEAGWLVALPADRLVDLALAGYEETQETRARARGDLLEFISDRVRTMLEAPPFSFAYDEVAAGMAAGWTASLPDLRQRIAAVRAVRNQPRFLSLLDSAKRIANITAGQEGGRIERSLMTDPGEKRLHDLAELVAEQIDELRAEGRYEEALDAFAAMADDLQSFFVEVLVMVDDLPVRANRMALLHRVGGLVCQIADVTRIVVDRKEYERR